MNEAVMMRRVLATVFAPREQMTCSEWAERYRIVADGQMPGPWRHARTPYLIGVMDAFTDPDVQSIAVMKGSQTGGTACVYTMMMVAIDTDPGPMMLVYPSQKSGAEKNELRLTPTFRATPRIAARMSPRPHDTKKSSIRFDACDLVMRGAANEHHLESDPIRYVFVDELDRCGPRTAHLVRQRTKTFHRPKVVFISKPGLEGQGIHAEMEQSDWQRYAVPCPHCGGYHVRTRHMLVWEGLGAEGETRWDSRDTAIEPGGISAAAQTAAIQCPACKGRIGPEFNLWQLSLGVWVPRSMTVERLRANAKAPADGTPARNTAEARARWINEPGVLKGDRPPKARAGYQIPEFVSGLMTNPYAETVSDLIALRGVMTPDFLADRCGEAWSPAGRKIDMRELRARIIPMERGGFRLGQIPSGVRRLVAGVDVQTDGCWVSVRGFGPYGKESWHIWSEWVPRTDGDDLSQLDPLLYGRVWKRMDGLAMRISARAIDSGHDTISVYEYCAKRSGAYAMKGVGESRWNRAPSWPVRTSTVEVRPDQVRLRAPVKLVAIHSGLWKSRTLARYRLPHKSEEAGGVTDDALQASPGSVASGTQTNGVPWAAIGGRVLYFPVDVGDEYLAQITAEECVVSQKGLRRTYEWRLRQGATDNHLFDAEVYIEGLAESLGLSLLPMHEPSPSTGPPTSKPTPKPAPNPYIDEARRSGPLVKK